MVGRSSIVLPARFVSAGTRLKPLPKPVYDGSIDALRSFVNIKSEDDFVLMVSWMLAALRNIGPYPLLVVSGEQG